MIFDDWRLYALLSAIFAALTAIFGKLGVENIASDLATFIRALLIAFLAAVFVSVKREWMPFSEISRQTYFFLVLSGLASGLSWLAYYKALKMASASKVAPIDKLSVVLVVLFAGIFLGETITLKIAAGTLLIGAGILLLAL